MSARDFVREWGPTVADATLLVIGFSLDHQDVLSGWLRDWYPVIQPVGFFALGAFGGYSVAQTLGRRALAKEMAERGEEIASLKAELARCPTRKQLDESDAQLTKRAVGADRLVSSNVNRRPNETTIASLDLIPSLTHRQRAMLLVAYSNGEVTTTEDTDRAALQLVREGYLVDLGENHYALPTKLAHALENRGDLLSNLKSARDPSDLL